MQRRDKVGEGRMGWITFRQIRGFIYQSLGGAFVFFLVWHFFGLHACK
jgi:hypothetical protein